MWVSVVVWRNSNHAGKENSAWNNKRKRERMKGWSDGLWPGCTKHLCMTTRCDLPTGVVIWDSPSRNVWNFIGCFAVMSPDQLTLQAEGSTWIIQSWIGTKFFPWVSFDIWSLFTTMQNWGSSLLLCTLKSHKTIKSVLILKSHSRHSFLGRKNFQ